jgi:hypothetical protein
LTSGSQRQKLRLVRIASFNVENDHCKSLKTKVQAACGHCAIYADLNM